jgi:hypothetical protein
MGVQSGAMAAGAVVSWPPERGVIVSGAVSEYRKLPFLQAEVLAWNFGYCGRALTPLIRRVTGLVPTKAATETHGVRSTVNYFTDKVWPYGPP